MQRMKKDNSAAAPKREAVVRCETCDEPIDLSVRDRCEYCSATDDRDGPEDIYLGADPFSDLGNAERLEAASGRELLHAPGLGWLVYDGTRFAPDHAAAARRVHAVAKMIMAEADEAEEAGDEDRADRLRSWSASSQNRRSIENALAVATTIESMGAEASSFDRDGFLLNVRNGTLDLRTGVLAPHGPEDRLTKLAPVRYDPDATCPTWTRFLDRIFDANAGVIEFVQRAVGYTLTGDVREQVLFLLHGSGANGKSTFLEALGHALGDYGATTSADTLLATKNGRGIENDLARLRGSRFVATVEVGEGRRLDEERVKRMTGGDTLTARFLYKEHFEFSPTFKLWLGCNALPRVRGADHAIWRRIRLVPFEVTIPDSEQDKDLPQKLRAEASGILRWAVEGCLAWQRDGLTAPPEVTGATDVYRSDENIVARFVEEVCEIGAQHHATSADLYDRFCRWCDKAGEHAPSNREFGKRLAQFGSFVPYRSESARGWRGLRPRLDAAGAESSLFLKGRARPN
jgi:putative DNA primase/helicase